MPSPPLRYPPTNRFGFAAAAEREQIDTLLTYRYEGACRTDIIALHGCECVSVLGFVEILVYVSSS